MAAAPAHAPSPDLQALAQPLLVVKAGARPSATRLLHVVQQLLPDAAPPSLPVTEQLVRLGASLRHGIDSGSEQVKVLEQTLAAVDSVVAPHLDPAQLARWNQVVDGAASDTTRRANALQLHRTYTEEIARAEKIFVLYSTADSFDDVDWSGVVWHGTPDFSREVLRAVRWACGMKGSNRRLVEFEPEQVAERLADVIDRARDGKGVWYLSWLRAAVVDMERERPVRAPTPAAATPEPTGEANAQVNQLGRGKRTHQPVDYSHLTAPQPSKKRSTGALRPASHGAPQKAGTVGAVDKIVHDGGKQAPKQAAANVDNGDDERAGASNGGQARPVSVEKAGPGDGHQETLIPNLPGDVAGFLELPGRVIKANKFMPDRFDCDDEDGSYSLRWPRELAFPGWHFSLADLAERADTLDKIDFRRARGLCRFDSDEDDINLLGKLGADDKVELLSQTRLILTDIVRQQSLVIGYLLADLHLSYCTADSLKGLLADLGQPVPKFGPDGRPISKSAEVIAAESEAARKNGRTTIPREEVVRQVDARHLLDEIPEELVHAAAQGLADSLTVGETERNLLYPDVERIRDVSIKIAVTVIEAAQKLGVDRAESLRGKSSAELEHIVRRQMYHPLLNAEEQQTLPK